MITADRIYRSFEFRAAPEDEFYIEGYALTFDQPTLMYEWEGVKYFEQIKAGALDAANITDVVLNFDHGGKPVARTKNKTLVLTVDAIGLKVRAYLGGTEEGKRLYQEVKGGYLDKMSFAFTINADEYNRDTHMRTITEVKRIYDVAIVTFPAYESTSVQARSFFEVEAEKEIAEARNKLELAKAKALLM